MTSEQVSAIGAAFAGGLRRILGDKLVAAYIYGAAAFPDTSTTGDVDFHVILQSELTEQERAELEELHQTLARQFPPLGAEMDGYYILLADARREAPPQSQMWARARDTAWALHRQHIRAGRYIRLHGPDPREIYPAARWSEIEIALQGELDYVERHLQDYPDYCILNLCRLVYSFRTQDVVVSKAAAADWASEELPQWRRHIEVAKKSYAGQATLDEKAFMLAEVERFFAFARALIEASSQRWRHEG
ncbi:MAG: aminoglycoside adenylyltransferase domain-containing protein [Chloroflexota bacterium]